MKLKKTNPSRAMDLNCTGTVFFILYSRSGSKPLSTIYSRRNGSSPSRNHIQVINIYSCPAEIIYKLYIYTQLPSTSRTKGAAEQCAKLLQIYCGKKKTPWPRPTTPAPSATKSLKRRTTCCRHVSSRARFGTDCWRRLALRTFARHAPSTTIVWWQEAPANVPARLRRGFDSLVVLVS